MNENKTYKVALVLYTQGIDYDDRIRKEILSIQKLYSNVSFKIFAVEPQNREEEGVSSYGVPYRIPYLKSRNKYTSGTHTLAKAWDFYKSIKNDLTKYDAVWCADPETFIFILMLHGKPLAWDLHELPIAFMGNPVMRLLFRYLEKKSTVMIHANEPRLKYLQKIGMIKYPQKQFYLRNYPQFNEIDSDYDETYEKFIAWKGDDKCVYLQGLMGEKRADVESIGAVLSIPGLKAVVIGKIIPDRMKIFESKYGKKELLERIFFTGQLKQLKTPQYIKQCFMSLVFYKNSTPNNWYCEPNRLFQNVINGNPVVVGNNPPMKEFVEENHFGISVDTDGSDMFKIVEGMKYVMSNYDSMKKSLSNVSDKLLWNSQESTIRKIVDTFLGRIFSKQL